MKKILNIFFVALLMACFCSPVFAEADTYQGNRAGHTVIRYTAEKKPAKQEVPKGEGNQTNTPVTGDPGLADLLKFLVTASVGTLMLIIFIRKRRTTL